MHQRKVVIESLEQARELVIQFNKKIDNMYRNIDTAQNHAIQGKSISDSVNELNISQTDNEKLIRAATVIQSRWRGMRARDTLIPLNLKNHHASDVIVFANNQNIKINLNSLKQDELLRAYQQQDWQAEIFSDPFLLQTALALFASGKLKNAEFETILIMQYAKIPLRSYAKSMHLSGNYKLSSYKILDNNNTFTKEAKNYLLENLPKFMYEDFDDTQIRNFKLIAQAFFEIYPAENVFFTVYSGEYREDSLAIQLNRFHLSSVIYVGKAPRIQLFLNLTDYLNDKEKQNNSYVKVILPCIVENALQLACFPLDDVVAVRSVAGDLSKSDIERCVDAGLRPGAVSFPDVPRSSNIHNQIDISDSSRRDHDSYHAQHMCRQGKTIREAFRRIKNLSRDIILKNCANLQGTAYPQLFSNATWQLVDAEFEYFNHTPDHYSTDNNVVKFCSALDNEKIIILFDQNTVTDLGVITFMDMNENMQIWKESGFDPESLISKYKNQFEIAKKLQPFFKKDDPVYNLIIFRIYTIFGKDSFNAILELLSGKDITKCVEFRRNNKTDFMGLVNKKSGKKLTETLAFTLLQFILGETVIHKDFDIKLHKNLFDRLLQLHLHFSHFPFMRSKVFQPMYKLVKKVMEYNDPNEFQYCREYVDTLGKFYEHHAKSADTQIKDKLLILFKIYKDLDNFTAPYKNSIKKGFLLGERF